MNCLVSLLLAALLLTACGGAPPPPDWKLNAVSLIEHFQQSWLEGNGKSADLALEKARSEIAKTGRLDLLARLEVAACGTRSAGLDFGPCDGFARLAPDATTNDRAYARFLTGDWTGLDGKLLPAQYADLAGAKDDASANHALAGIKDPLPRLIGAALLFKTGRADPATLRLAMDTASAQGWRRPLLAWLEVELRRARGAGDNQAADQLQRRIDLILEKSPPRP